jgi:hypothetical protein
MPKTHEPRHHLPDPRPWWEIVVCYTTQTRTGLRQVVLIWSSRVTPKCIKQQRGDHHTASRRWPRTQTPQLEKEIRVQQQNLQNSRLVLRQPCGQHQARRAYSPRQSTRFATRGCAGAFGRLGKDLESVSILAQREVIVDECQCDRKLFVRPTALTAKHAYPAAVPSRNPMIPRSVSTRWQSVWIPFFFFLRL